MLDPSKVSEVAANEMLSRVRQRFSMKPRVALAGFGKSGKSSLFNALYGERVASVSMKTDETVEAQTRERFGIDFTDTPGFGTGRFSLDKVTELGVFDQQHVVIHVLNGTTAISDEDVRLHEAIERSSSRRLTVVNKVDLLDDRELSEVAQSMSDKLGLSPDRFLFVSARRGTNVPELVEHIAFLLPEAMQDAFIGQQRAGLRIKERRVRALVYSKATVCGAIGLVPIPVADLFVLTPIQLGMVAAIGYFHGVEVTRERAFDLTTTVGAGLGLRETARQLIKLVPGWGCAISAAVAFAGTVALGEAANFWFKHRMKASPTDLREVFERTAARAKTEFQAREAKATWLSTRLARLRRDLESGLIDTQEYELRVAELSSEAPEENGDA